ncbi:tRNA methyltransferase 44 [Sparganum proliferum]
MSSGDFTIRIVYPKLFTEIDPFTEEIRFDSRGYHFASKHASYSVVIVGGSPKWFHECLEARLCHWASMSLDHSPPSLNLVNYENYQKVYARLKTCYWDDLRASWCEKTYPEKFIHEDFGIAAYLICIWSSLKKDVYFVDIGCGVDIKRRGMWGQYPARIAAALREETLDPSTHPGFPQATFLIGNHSDELTPWLPVLATKSNSECQVFTVPCCPFSLYQKFDAGQYTQQLRDGVYQQFTDYRQRYSPTFTTESTEEPNLIAEGGFWRGRYRHYIHYLEDVFRICGFEPELDILRIPSTKRICLLGRQHTKYLTYSQRLGNVNKLLELESHPCRSRGCDDSSNTATKPKTADTRLTLVEPWRSAFSK